MHDNQNRRIYQCLSEYHFLNPVHLKRFSNLPEPVRIELKNLTSYCSRFEERIIKLDKIIKDVKISIDTKQKGVKHNG